MRRFQRAQPLPQASLFLLPRQEAGGLEEGRWEHKGDGEEKGTEGVRERRKEEKRKEESEGMMRK